MSGDGGSPRPSGALRLLGWVARLVPRARRTEWLEEWRAELDALYRERGPARRPADGRDPGALPHPMVFVLGALPHALWMRKEEWTMDGVTQDLRYALRVLSRAPGFTLVATLTLALGIGANATIFSLVNGLVLRAPPGIHEPDRLVQIARSYDEAPRWDNWSWPALRAIRAESRVFDDVAGYSGTARVVGSGADAEQVSALLVTGNYFDVLGVRPAVGRLLSPADDMTPGGHPVVVLGHALWQRRFGGDASVVGTTVPVAGAAYEVVGVAPAGFGGTETVGAPPQLFLPATMYPASRGRLPFEEWGWSWIYAVGRLAPGVDMASVPAAMDVVTTRLREASAGNEDIRVLVAPGVGMSPEERAEARRISLLLTGVAGVVLLLTCANVANLFIARATTRQGEMGVRLALGAGRSRLARQLVTESLVLGVLAAVLAVVPLTLGARALPALLPYTVSVSLAPDGAVFLSLVALGLLSGLLFGALPSIAAARRDVAGTLRASGTTGATRRSRVRDGLVVLQLGLSLALLAGATLLGSSILHAAGARPGFEPRGVLVAYMDLGGTGRYDEASSTAFAEALVREVRSLPGVTAAAIASQAPFLGGYARASRTPADRPEDPSLMVEAEAIVVGDGYFEAMEIPLLRGRTLRSPSAEPEAVAVVNETLARRFWPGQEAVGKELAGEPTVRVVGVVGDVQNRSLRTPPPPAVYEPLSSSLNRRLALHVRTPGDPLALAPAVRDAVASLDPGLPVLTAVDLQGQMAASLGATRTIASLVAVFAGLALVLSVVGLYGLVSFGVSQRVREMGIRMALGAAPAGLVRLVLRRALALTAVGVMAGLALAVLVGRALGGLLFGVAPADPLAMAGAAGMLVGAALVAAWLPARRASRVDAAVSLRDGQP